MQHTQPHAAVSLCQATRLRGAGAGAGGAPGALRPGARPYGQGVEAGLRGTELVHGLRAQVGALPSRPRAIASCCSVVIPPRSSCWCRGRVVWLRLSVPERSLLGSRCRAPQSRASAPAAES